MPDIFCSAYSGLSKALPLSLLTMHFLGERFHSLYIHVNLQYTPAYARIRRMPLEAIRSERLVWMTFFCSAVILLSTTVGLKIIPIQQIVYTFPVLDRYVLIFIMLNFFYNKKKQKDF